MLNRPKPWKLQNIFWMHHTFSLTLWWRSTPFSTAMGAGLNLNQGKRNTRSNTVALQVGTRQKCSIFAFLLPTMKPRLKLRRFHVYWLFVLLQGAACLFVFLRVPLIFLSFSFYLSVYSHSKCDKRCLSLESGKVKGCNAEKVRSASQGTNMLSWCGDVVMHLCKKRMSEECFHIHSSSTFLHSGRWGQHFGSGIFNVNGIWWDDTDSCQRPRDPISVGFGIVESSGRAGQDDVPHGGGTWNRDWVTNCQFFHR